MLENIISELEKQFQLEAVDHNGSELVFLTIDRDRAVMAIDLLKWKFGYKHFVLLTAVDFLEEGKFQLTYILNNPDTKTDIGIRVRIERENANMESAHHLWPTVATYQRELKEMFGIDFPGSPRFNDPFILEGWEGTPPYRRDFDTKAFAASFYHQREGRTTNDPATYMKEKLYPNE